MRSLNSPTDNIHIIILYLSYSRKLKKKLSCYVILLFLHRFFAIPLNVTRCSNNNYYYYFPILKTKIYKTLQLGIYYNMYTVDRLLYYF